MQQKPIGESRIPTDVWSGFGFSKSMPESVIRERMAQTGVKQRYESPMATTYEVRVLIKMMYCSRHIMKYDTLAVYVYIFCYLHSAAVLIN